MVALFRCPGVVNGCLRQHWADYLLVTLDGEITIPSSPACRPLINAVGQPEIILKGSARTTWQSLFEFIDWHLSQP